jgi:DNA-binding MarR family transcriptional regulator
MEQHIDPDLFEAWALFLRTHADVVRLLGDELEKERDLPLTSYEVLLRLSGAERPWRMHELADSLFLSRSGATRVVEKLEKAGLVAREICEGDRRGIQITVTAEGKRTLRAAAPVHLRGIEEHFTKHLTRTEAAHLRSAFTKILDATQSDQETTTHQRADAAGS